MRTYIRYGHDVGDDLRASQTFEIAEEKQFVFLDRPSKAGAELILTKRRRPRSRVSGLDDVVEEVPRFELVVAEKLVNGSVKIIGARAARRIDHGAVPAELRGVCICQRLEFRDGFHTERRSQSACAGAVIPEVHHVLIVEKIGLA